MHILTSRSIFAELHVKEVLKDIINENMKVCVVALSHFEPMSKETYKEIYGKNGEYYLKMINIFEAYEIKEEQVSFVYLYDSKKEDNIKMINDADLLYFPGGAPDLMIERIDRLGLREAIENHKGVFCGSSAGAMIQFKKFHISPDNDYPHFKLCDGLNFIKDFIIEVHYKRHKKQKSAMRYMHRNTKKDIYLLPDEGLIIYDGKKPKCYFGAKQYYGKKGIVK